MNYGERHDFLRSLHELLRPATYLEIGVQTGRSLAQVPPYTMADAVDPRPCISVPINCAYVLSEMTSDAFFAERDEVFNPEPYDLAFIDGMHLFENVLDDFMNVERYARPDRRSVAVIDDVLPYSNAITGRWPLPGDWAGDVWKIVNALESVRADLRFILVDVDPTGVLVVLDLDPASTTLKAVREHLHAIYVQDMAVPEHQLRRDYAVKPARALDIIRDHLHITEA